MKNPLLILLLAAATVALLGAILPFTPLAHILGFSTLPLTFFLILFGMILLYLALVEGAKTVFYQREALRPQRAARTPEQHRIRRIRKQTGRFVQHRLSPF